MTDAPLRFLSRSFVRAAIAVLLAAGLPCLAGEVDAPLAFRRAFPAGDLPIPVVRVDGVGVDRVCADRPERCAALIHRPPIPPTPKGGHRAAAFCSAVGGTNLILSDEQRNEYDFCEFPDGSLADSWQLLTRYERQLPLVCTTRRQYYCEAEGCTTGARDIDPPHRYRFDPNTRDLSMCVPGCYTGTATVFTHSEDKETTAIGIVVPEAPESIGRLLSLTIGKQLAFVAIWTYAGSGILQEHGTCVRK